MICTDGVDIVNLLNCLFRFTDFRRMAITRGAYIVTQGSQAYLGFHASFWPGWSGLYYSLGADKLPRSLQQSPLIKTRRYSCATTHVSVNATVLLILHQHRSRIILGLVADGNRGISSPARTGVQIQLLSR